MSISDWLDSHCRSPAAEKVGKRAASGGGKIGDDFSAEFIQGEPKSDCIKSQTRAIAMTARQTRHAELNKEAWLFLKFAK